MTFFEAYMLGIVLMLALVGGGCGLLFWGLCKLASGGDE